MLNIFVCYRQLFCISPFGKLASDAYCGFSLSIKLWSLGDGYLTHTPEKLSGPIRPCSLPKKTSFSSGISRQKVHEPQNARHIYKNNLMIEKWNKIIKLPWWIVSQKVSWNFWSIKEWKQKKEAHREITIRLLVEA